jgi:hypothetical protein
MYRVRMERLTRGKSQGLLHGPGNESEHQALQKKA